ncbi:MAG: Xaa-Pro peptidase family protein [candidate division NC10 bacterium]
MNLEPRTLNGERRTVDAQLIIAVSEIDANLFYATRFLAPDAFVFVLTPTGEKVLLMSDLEVDRARAQAAVDTVLPIRRFEERAKASGVERPGILDSVCAFLAEREIRTVRVPGSFPIEYGDGLRERGVAVQVRREPFFEKRLLKTADEVEAISRAMRRTEGAMDAAIGAIREAEVRDGVLWWRGETLTAERVRRLISMTLIEDGLLAQHTIVACGEAGCDPHNEGSGPLHAGQSIIIDIFPRDEASRYFADITRTVVKGRASEMLRKMYRAVAAGQERVFALLRDGSDGEAIHREVQDTLERHGFQSGEVNGRMQGFFHGTGHGLGLEVHELPRISKLPTTLESGNVVTVEPGLYYPGIGGVRIEDVVVVTKTGCTNLTRYPKELEV